MNLVAKSYIPDLLLKLIAENSDVKATYLDSPEIYKVLGVSTPAGVLKGTSELVVYQSNSGVIYHRNVGDFCCKMNLVIES